MDFETNASQVRDDPQPGTGGGEEQEGVWLKEEKHSSDGEFLRDFQSVATEDDNLKQTLYKHKLQHKYIKQTSRGMTDVTLTIQETQGKQADRVHVRLSVIHSGEAHTSFKNVKKWLAQRANELLANNEDIGKKIATYMNRQREQREQKAKLPVLQMAFPKLLTGKIILSSELKSVPDNSGASGRVFAADSPIFYSSQMYIDFEGTGRRTPLFCSMLFPDKNGPPTLLSVGLLHCKKRFQELKEWLQALAAGRTRAGLPDLTVNFWGGNESELLAECARKGLSLNNIQPSGEPKGLSDCYNGLGISDSKYAKDSKIAQQMDTCADTFEIIKQSALSHVNYRELLNVPMVQFCEADVVAMYQIHTSYHAQQP